MRTPAVRRAPVGAPRLLAAACAAVACLTAAPAPAAARAPDPPPARVVTITARDYAFEMPDTVAAGRTELRLVNQGPDLHHAWLVRLDHGHTPAEFFAAVRRGGAAPRWAQQVGGPNTPAPGGTSAAVLDLAPGNYIVLCGVPADDGQPHLRLGMIRTFAVVPASAARAAVPARRTSTGAAGARAVPAARAAARPAAGPLSTVGAPDATLTLTDRGFALSAPLTAGRHVLRVRNQGTQVHEVLVARLAPSATAEQALNWFEGKQGPSPMVAVGGAVGLARGEYNDVPLDLAPGEYALLCRQPDVRADHGHGATHRMVQQISVK